MEIERARRAMKNRGVTLLLPPSLHNMPPLYYAGDSLRVFDCARCGMPIPAGDSTAATFRGPVRDEYIHRACVGAGAIRLTHGEWEDVGIAD
jgi:hypothetical protein